jgi:putative membrane protein
MENYSKFSGSLILRDYLALDRTVLANERTLLSYIRLFLGLLSVGAGMVEILDFLWATILGYILIGIAPLVIIVGIIRYYKMQKRIKTIQNVTNNPLELLGKHEERNG